MCNGRKIGGNGRIGNYPCDADLQTTFALEGFGIQRIMEGYAAATANQEAGNVEQRCGTIDSVFGEASHEEAHGSIVTTRHT